MLKSMETYQRNDIKNSHDLKNQTTPVIRLHSLASCIITKCFHTVLCKAFYCSKKVQKNRHN